MFLEEGIKILLIAGSILFIIFAYLCDLWTDRDPKKAKNILGGLTVSFLYSFKVVIFSFLIIFIISLFLDKSI